MKAREDIFNKATDAEHDEIIDLVDKLPSQFFGEYPEWEKTAERLGILVSKIKYGMSDTERLDALCELLQCERRDIYEKVKGLLFYVE